MNHYAITANQINKRYGQKTALHDFSLHLPANQVIGILGANGAGKSTFSAWLPALSNLTMGA
ncbi:ATP-binding cassette domain-containing protein [Paenibacillus larvae]|nr:ATP-binding cassette domain-containing protein [Paenibacillus larvae]MDT2257723.1 ATP-binding cassette domain-containing protein [Paenibacillus larvae]MDT2260109.1 ATP-binding cassette domain-containing protein [Paenibacillus larvae]MDT2265040.1 ATP-binding cassette domain-containing protein [Paenibacillus larvae]MDT2304607.1 ATP-binding cassette domain-containing protein [Paenibacillus larvae]